MMTQRARRQLVEAHGFTVVAGRLLEFGGWVIAVSIALLVLTGIWHLGVAVFSPHQRQAMTEQWGQRAIEDAKMP